MTVRTTRSSRVFTLVSPQRQELIIQQDGQERKMRGDEMNCRDRRSHRIVRAHPPQRVQRWKPGKDEIASATNAFRWPAE